MSSINFEGGERRIPPPHLDTGQPRTNTHWHPERMLGDIEDGEDESDCS